MKIHVLKCGEVRVSPYLPFGGKDCGTLKAAGFTTPKSKWIWLPAFCYLIEHPKGNILVDTGWHREMSPNGIYNKQAQINSLGSRILYIINQGILPKGEAINEQLEKMGLAPSDLDYVILTHLDCDHANGLKLVSDAKNIIVSADEMKSALGGNLFNRIRYQRKWWEGTKISTFDWKDAEGPVKESYNLFEDGSISLINIPGHSKGMCAVKITNSDGKFVLLAADGGYAERSWKDMILSGIADDRVAQQKSLEWIREQSLSEKCIKVLATHDTDVKPQVIEF